MPRLENYVAIGVLVVVAIFSRRIALQIMGPGTAIWDMAVDASLMSTGDESNAEWARTMFNAVTTWVPWLAVAGSVVVTAYQEFSDQRVTRARR